MNQKVIHAGDALRAIYDTFEKDLVLGQPLFYGREVEFICGDHDYTKYAPFWYHPDHLGSSSYITNLAGEINQHMEYLPFGELLVEEHLNSYNSPFKFNAKELDAETGNYYYGARYYSPKYNLMLSVDQMYDLYPSFSPYAYTLQNPVRYVDPTGMTPEDNPVFGSDGSYRGNTKEGYTGAVLIYDGDLDFSQMSADELEYNTADGATHYDYKRHELSGEAKSNIWTDVASKMDGMEIYDETFSMSDLEGGKIHFDSNISGGWTATYRRGTGKGK